MPLAEKLKGMSDEMREMGMEARLGRSLRITKEELKKQAREELREELAKMIREEMMKIRIPKDGKDGLPGKEGRPGKDATVEGRVIRDELQTLKGEERLDASAIKNLDKEIQKISPLGFGRQISGSGAGATTIEEVPTGTINGSNVTFTLSRTPRPGSVRVYLNGLRQRTGSGNDFTISGLTITFATAPPTGSNLFCDYEPS